MYFNRTSPVGIRIPLCGRLHNMRYNRSVAFYFLTLFIVHYFELCCILNYRIVGDFQGEISLWFSIIKFICGKKICWFTALVSSQLNHKIKSSWVKHSWFYSNHENQRYFTLENFPLYVDHCAKDNYTKLASIKHVDSRVQGYLTL